ncbi:MAG: metal-dependent hydrolase [Firmicutes bacterium]|nr:metal-dependent hydrolase [Bacillota bacterium]
MNGPTHMGIGALTGGLVLAYGIANRTLSFGLGGYEIYPLAVTIAAAMGGLAPDVDMARSTAGKFLRKLIRAGLIISALFLIVMDFVQPTGIEILDGAIGMGARVDRGVPIVLAVFCLLIFAIIDKSKHRGFTHTTVGLVFVACPLVFMLLTGTMFVGADIAVSVQIGFVLGWFSHMVIDSFNYPGTPWLWPVVKKHFRVMRIGSGTQGEAKFMAMSVVVFIMCYALIIL